MAPEAVGESLDPRDPLLRLSNFFDDGSIELLHERDRSGVLAASGTVNGVRTIAFCTDGTVMGGAMGIEGCTHIVNAYDTAIEEQSPIVGIWHSGGARLAEGVKALHAVGTGVRGDDSRVRLHPADLGGRRLRRRRRRLRPGADRRHRDGAGKPGVRHRARRGAQRHRRGRGHGARSAARKPTTRSPGCATSSPTTSSTPTSVAADWSDCSASRGISTAPRPRPVTPTSTRCCRNRRGGPTTCIRS